MKISDDDLQRARDESADAWSIGNKVLYDLCKQYPRHDNASARAVVAKVWLIGRSYAAAIERSCKRPPKEPVDALYTRIAEALAKSDLDSSLNSLSAKGPQSQDDLVSTVEIHRLFLSALKHLTQRTPRSFASKYLHFHAPPWFFIYDSVASNGLRRVLDRHRTPGTIVARGDRTYGSFVAGAWTLREHLAERPPRLTTRELDTLLLRYGA